MRESINPNAYVHGKIRMWRLPTNGRPQPATPWVPNQVLYSWATILANLLTAGTQQYRINGILLEYKNVASPSDTVPAPAFDRTGGIGYYIGLASSPDVDFLRVPLTAFATGNSNPALFPTDNVLTFLARSQGLAGVHGKPFSDSHNSLIYGTALVAQLVEGDYTQDVVFSRAYLPEDQQQIKLPTSQIGLQWKLVLE